MPLLLNISSTPLKLEYNGTSGSKGYYNMKRNPASFDINIDRPEIKIESHPIKVHIDRREMFASMGVYMPEQFRRKTEDESKQIVLETIGEIGDDARAMVESQGAAFQSICLRKGGYNMVELESTHIPKVKPEITWSGGDKPDVSFTPFKMDINWNVPLAPDVEYHRGKVNIAVSQWHKVNIAYNDTRGNDNKIVGKKLNFKI